MIKTGSMLLFGGGITGCIGGGRTNTQPDDTENKGSSIDDVDGDHTESYTAEIAPVGQVEFESRPQEVFTIVTNHADMAFSLGYGDDMTAVFSPEYNDLLMNTFAARLDGVSVDWSGLYGSWNPSKEKLYSLDSDVHLADPANVVGMDNWSIDDIEDVRENAAPWFGNSLSATHRDPPPEFAEEYEYYTLWELFERVAEALDERERYEILTEVRNGILDTVEGTLPPEEDRPEVAMILPSFDGDKFWVYDVEAPGFYSAHTRPLGTRNAFEDVPGDETSLDYESLLEADPDVILVLGGMVDQYDMPGLRETLREHPVAGDVTAVQNERVYAQGTRHQGPTINIFQLEMTAKQLYPDEFGDWYRYDEGNYPEIPEDEQMFDRGKVARAIGGEIA